PGKVHNSTLWPALTIPIAETIATATAMQAHAKRTVHRRLITNSPPDAAYLVETGYSNNDTASHHCQFPESCEFDGMVVPKKVGQARLPPCRSQCHRKSSLTNE